MRRGLRYAALALAAALVVAAGAFVLWALNPLGPGERALAALESDSEVIVSEAGWLSFQPASSQPVSGLILYPGGHVDYRSYAPLARLLAARGYYVAIVPMPLNLAVFRPDAASEVIASHPEISYWTVGGHSLGGVMAAQYAAGHLAEVNGLALLAAYPGKDLSTSELRVLQVYASHDGLLSASALENAAQLLPAGTIEQVIEGGNHSQFGDYGRQGGDGQATISAEQQTSQTVGFLVRLLRSVEGE